MFWDPLLKLAKNTWNAWDIQAIVLLSMTVQLILLMLGSLRSRIARPWVRFIVWASYLMASWIATVGISKLSELTVEDPYAPDTETALGALLVPLFLLHLGSPDTITAYSIEDNQLGIREMFGVIAQVGLVIWVLFDSWTYTRLSSLTVPLFCAGLIKYGERGWSLWSALKEDVGVTTSEKEEKETIPQLLSGLGDQNNAGLILKAYYRFDHLKPHLENWVYRPFYLSDDTSMSIDPSDTKKAFQITDIELGFMYDALYTKLPLIYSRVGFLLRFLAFIGIVLTFCGFALIVKPSLHQRDPTFTYAVLLVAVAVELYSDARLLFTDWAIVWMTMTGFHKVRLLKELVQFLAKLSVRRNRWSHRLYQFNIVGFCLRNRHKSLMTKFLGLFCLDEIWEKYRFKGETEICDDLKDSVLKKMVDLDNERQKKPFTKCGSWTIKKYNVSDSIRETICTEFGRSIAMWHIATRICYHEDVNHSTPREVSKWLSDYMMHLLVNVPGMLSIPSGPIIFSHLREVITEMCKDLPPNASSIDEGLAWKHLYKELEKERESDTVENKLRKPNDPVNELKWSILPEAHKLAKELENQDTEAEKKEATSSNKKYNWEVIFSVWVDMLCYAADNCTLYSHAEQLRRGGEFLTPIWILISHNTDRFNTATCV